jgi:DNA-binding transcriptional MerR regulator
MLNGSTTAQAEFHPTDGDGVDYSTWLDDKSLRDELGLNAAQLQAFLRRGLIAKKRTGDGRLRFEPLDVERLRVHLEGSQAADLANQKEVNSELKDVLAKACKLLEQGHAHIEKMFGLLTAPQAEGFKFLTQIVASQNARIEAQQSAIDGAISLREEMLSRAHERSLKEQKFHATQIHINSAIEGISAALGPTLAPLMQSLAAKAGMGSPHPGMELLEHPDTPALVLKLAQLGLLPAAQLTACRKLWPDLAWPADAQSAPASAAPAEPPATPPPAAEPPAAPPAAPEEEPPPSTQPTPRRRRRSNQKDKT